MMNGGKVMDKPLVKIEYKTANGSRICVEVSTSVKELLISIMTSAYEVSGNPGYFEMECMYES